MYWTLRSVMTFIVALSLGHLAFGDQAMAKMRVLESSAPDIAVNSEIADDTRIDLPENTAIAILKIPECKALEITGPYSGTVADYLDKKRGIWTRVQDLWKRLVGDTDSKSGLSIGGTRGPLKACQ